MPFAGMTAFCNNIGITITIKVSTNNLLKFIVIPIPCSACDLFKVSTMTYKKFPTFPSSSVILWSGYEIRQSITIEITYSQSRLVNKICPGVIVILHLEIIKIGPCQLCWIFMFPSRRGLCYF